MDIVVSAAPSTWAVQQNHPPDKRVPDKVPSDKHPCACECRITIIGGDSLIMTINPPEVIFHSRCKACEPSSPSRGTSCFMSPPHLRSTLDMEDA